MNFHRALATIVTTGLICAIALPGDSAHAADPADAANSIDAAHPAHPAHPAQCSDSICIAVRSDPTTGKIIIDARKVIPGSTPRPTPRPTPRVTAQPTPRPSPKPSVKRTVNPTPRPYIRHIPYLYHPRAPQPAKTLSPPKVVNAINLADQISQLLPPHNVFVEPPTGIVTQMPTYFWTDTPTFFNQISAILGVAVSVSLRPTFTWSFGDGGLLISDQSGGPFPSRSNEHTYRRAGNYLLTLNISWVGSWSAGSYSYPVIGGAIIQSYSTRIKVSPAPTLFGH